MNSHEVITALKEKFFAHQGYTVQLTGETRADGKKLKKYSLIPKQLDEPNYSNHYNTAIGLTPSPVVEEENCYFGAIDVDTYDMDQEQRKWIIIKAHELGLACELTTSNGFHLYAFIKDDQGILCKTMRNFLNYCRAELKLPGDTEIFPKQDKTDKVGNGITIPYWNYKHKKLDTNCGCTVDNKDRIIKMEPELWLRSIDNHYTFNARDLIKYDNLEYKETPDQESTPDNYNPGSMQDPDMQKLKGSEILSKIVKQKMSIDDDSFFDDLITLYIGKGVGAYRTDDDILTPLLERLDPDITGVESDYFRAKLDRSRRNLGIDDPEVARKKFLERIVYLKDTGEFFDLEKGKSYSKETIDFEYAMIFGKTKMNPTTWLKQNPKRLIVESFKCKPDLYSKDSKIIEDKGFKFINSWRPNDLVAVKGDTKPWHDLLNHVFDDKTRHKEHFLDWIAFQLQNPGEKIHYAILLVSDNFRFGKGTIFRFLQKMFGSHNTLSIDIGQALDKSKTFLINHQLVLIDEMESHGTFDEKKKLLNSLKTIITENVASSRELYKDYAVIETCTNYMLFSNKKDALSLPPNEMRYWVFRNIKPRKKDEFYDYVYKFLDGEGPKHVLHELLERDVSEFKPKSPAPRTVYQEEMSTSGEHPLTKLVRDMFNELVFPFTEDRKVIGSMELHDWLKTNKKLGQARTNEVKNALESIGARDLGQVKIRLAGQKKDIKPTLYLIRDHEEHEGKTGSQLAELYEPLFEEDKS